ncbi:MarR family transcriptional regulator [Myxococcus sp. CA051A]|uniref:MarR family transcriptional regulator n=1 Tax=Myxococcus llanfairpwllgwyngyllgogerychwyrndrobwllllantysiliogogogochensis TaxID=2590453 RepID=A0A540X9K5_9BACT|nr:MULTISPECIES: MarR family transcriptional regulator [Myxococcus]NTX35819.1 MarR family transcriptional regulator [Myxococcus sp. CA033]NTX50141.1 MarR family transcriptional regulator [Myxococcus sp. CA039A]NTX63548.1 MarR family transcriptional regulator [Myxococcus sp. CA051A]TQF17986.1 MarR family transcriptional regulator [Myxococcus llanfairpwllgwyngyllgogerychwyrndrobwllllantysiliogogogochensis]
MSRSTQDHVDRLRGQWERELPDVDTQGMEILGRARRITLRVRPPIEAVFEEHGLDTGEFDVVSALLRSGPPYRMRPTELYKSLMISSGGLTDRLARLTRAGLIRRPATEGDARSLPVELTREGRERTEAAFRADMAVEARLLAGLSRNERATLTSLLRKLTLSLETAETEDG